jgi:hypothetical protein
MSTILLPKLAYHPLAIVRAFFVSRDFGIDPGIDRNDLRKKDLDQSEQIADVNLDRPDQDK